MSIGRDVDMSWLTDDNYAPREQSINSAPSSTKQASIPGSVVNLCKTMVGAGVLSLPYAMAHLGVVLGAAFVLVFASLSVYGLNLLVSCAGMLERRWNDKTSSIPLLSNKPAANPFNTSDSNDTFEGSSSFKERSPLLIDARNSRKPSFYSCAMEVFALHWLFCLLYFKIAPKTAVLIDIAITIKCFGVTVSYLLIIGQLLPDVMRLFIGSDIDLLVSRYFWITAFMLVLAPLSFMRKLDYLKFTSLAGLASIFYIVVVIVGYYIWGKEKESFDVIYAQVNSKIFTIYCELGRYRPEKRASIVTFISVPLVMVVYSIEAMMGYLTWGDTTDSNIINNYPTDTIPVAIARVCTTLVVTFSYPLLFFPARASLDSALFSWKGPAFYPLTRYCIETVALLGVGYAIAMCVEQLDLEVVGATGSTLICFVLPGFFYFKIAADDPFKKWKRIGALSLCIFGILLMVVCLSFVILNELQLIDFSLFVLK